MRCSYKSLENYISTVNIDVKKKYYFTAVIVEPREHKALKFVLENFLKNLNDLWQILIFHGNKNINYIKNIIDKDLKEYKNRILLINLNIDNLDIKGYNHLLTSKNFYEKIPTEIFLIFQTDSMICQENKNNIYDFMKYDYVGAPWKNINISGGNGGLSLRKKSKMLEFINKCHYKNENEDIYFSKGCNNFKLKLPSKEESMDFSSETIESKNPFGIHKSWLYIDNNNMEKKCRNSKILRDLNK